jgi:hypothetical protein
MKIKYVVNLPLFWVKISFDLYKKLSVILASGGNIKLNHSKNHATTASQTLNICQDNSHA